MFHAMKRSMKGVSNKSVVAEDTSLQGTKQTLDAWNASVSQLIATIQANEAAWNNIFGSIAAFQPAAAAIYPGTDSDAHSVLAALASARGNLDAPVEGMEPFASAVQRLDISKQELTALLTRFGEARSLHEQRLATIREYKYYDTKARGIAANEEKKVKDPTIKEVERRSRNQQKCAELLSRQTTLTNQIMHEMDALAVDRLAVTDRALAAVVLLQSHYFRANPLSTAYATGGRIGLGRRVLVRDERRPWAPPTNSAVPVNPAPAPNAAPAANYNPPVKAPQIAPPPPPLPPPQVPSASIDSYAQPGADSSASLPTYHTPVSSVQTGAYPIPSTGEAIPTPPQTVPQPPPPAPQQQQHHHSPQLTSLPPPVSSQVHSSPPLSMATPSTPPMPPTTMPQPPPPPPPAPLDNSWREVGDALDAKLPPPPPPPPAPVPEKAM